MRTKNFQKYFNFKNHNFNMNSMSRKADLVETTLYLS